MPDGLTDARKTHEDPESVSFVGRPFPLAEAPAHFARLREWGLTLVRFLVTWEALSHDGPYPQYPVDGEYVQYLRSLIELMPAYGLRCIICPHQDIWSRVTGGSGAPAWTLRAAGFDLSRLNESGAAYVPDARGMLHSTPPQGYEEPTGVFVWPSGYQKLAPATMATLFWAGRTFAPQLGVRVGERVINIQDYLQDAFIGAFGALADALAGLEACVAFEALNEPHRGYINLHSWSRWKYETDLHIGHFPSPLQGMALGDGHAIDIPFYTKSWPFPSRVSHITRVDPRGKAWLSADDPRYPTTRTTSGCIWAEHGVWGWDEARNQPVVLQSDYFHVDPRPGQGRRRVEWYRDFYAPFVKRFSDRCNAAGNNLFLVEPIPNEFMPPWSDRPVRQNYAVPTTIDTPRPRGMVYAPHIYDLNVLFFKSHGIMSVDVQGLSRGMFILCGIYFGRRGLLRNYAKQVGTLVGLGRRAVGAPTIIGEVGIPYDVNGGTAMRTGDYRVQHELMYALISALEQSFSSFTLWNYNPSNVAATGDGWNMEDFSIINLEERAADCANKFRDNELYRGGRTLNAIVRPYAAKVAGEPLRTRWNGDSGTFFFAWAARACGAPTEVYVPRLHFDHVHVRLSSGSYEYRPAEQTLYIHTPAGRQWVRVSRSAPTRWTELVLLVLAILAAVYALLR